MWKVLVRSFLCWSVFMIANCHADAEPSTVRNTMILAMQALEEAVETFKKGGPRACRRKRRCPSSQNDTNSTSGAENCRKQVCQPPNFDLPSGHYVFCTTLPPIGRFLDARWILHPVEKYMGRTGSDLMDDPIIGPYIEETADRIFSAALTMKTSEEYREVTYKWDNDLEGRDTELLLQVLKSSLIRWFTYDHTEYVCGIQVGVDPVEQENEQQNTNSNETL